MYWRLNAPSKAIAGALALLLAGLLQAAETARYGVEIIASYPHDAQAFTQGLLYADGVLYESIGRRGQSALRRVDIESGTVLAEQRLDDKYFGEGLALVGETLVQLTWQAGTGLVYDRDSLKPLEKFSYAGEGWGLTYDGKRLIMSDGTATLRFLDPRDYSQTGELLVTHQGQPVNFLNELEMVDGEIWANLWRYDLIVRIDPDSGEVTGAADAGSLRQQLPAGYKVDVLNGIAYDEKTGRLWLSGKLWPRLFEVRLRPVTPPGSNRRGGAGVTCLHRNSRRFLPADLRY